MSANYTPEKEDLKILTPFKMQVLTNFPYIEADFDALTNYQLLCKVVEYLNNVIAETNEVTEQTVSLYNAYVALENYVNNYFDNLDLQEEVNEKLDAMATDGSLTAIIKAYVDPIYQEYETEINRSIQNQNDEIGNFKSSVNTQINAIDNKVDSSTSGSPAGVYTTAEALAAANPDHTKIYLVTSDGKWYYYSTAGSSWVAGGTYLSAGIANGSITGIKTDFLNESFNILKMENKSGSSNGIDYTISDGVITLDGTAETTFYIETNIEPKTLNGPYRFTVGEVSGTGNVTVSIINNDSTIWCSLDNLSSDQINFCRGATYVQLKIRIPNETVLDNVILYPMIYKEKYYSEDMPYISYDAKLSTNHILDIGKNVITPENTTFMKPTANLVNLDNIVSGFCQGTSNGKLVIQASPSYYNYTVFNDTNQTKTYYVYPGYRMYIISTNRASGTSTLPTDTAVTTASLEPAFIEVPAYSRLNVTFYSNVTTPMIAESSEAINYVPFRYTIPHLYYDVDVSNLEGQITSINNDITDLKNSNVLYGKKLVTCGDSFTAYTNATFDSGIYQGLDKVWPYLIGLRNNMTVNNMAISGSTMAINAYSPNNFANNIYTQIPNDADYIIIKYGINDVNGQTPIGTINSNDDTTFYGAWNKVMNYIIANHPTAKIGIIVTNGLGIDTSAPDNSNYAHAIIEIARKFGIPTLNEWNDPNVPLLIRTGRTDVLDTIREMRKNTFKVSADNTHENYICHEYESTIIEDFLRRL